MASSPGANIARQRLSGSSSSICSRPRKAAWPTGLNCSIPSAPIPTWPKKSPSANSAWSAPTRSSSHSTDHPLRVAKFAAIGPAKSPLSMRGEAVSMARAASKRASSAVPAPASPNRERPPEPTRYEASKEELLEFYRQMLLIRRFEERAGQLYGLGLIGGFCHLYIGQEAVAVGLQSALKPGHDSVITGYRDHGHMLAYGIDPRALMAELTGRAAGIARGKGGSMHMFSVEHRFYGGHGIVGAQVSLGTGLAFKHKYAGDGDARLVYAA